VDRALDLFRVVAAEARPLLLEDIASRVGLNRSIAYRLVRSLENAGFLRREPQGGYTVGAAFLSLSMLTVSRIDLRWAARPAMDAIVARHGETASLAVRSGEQRVCVEVAKGVHPIQWVVSPGDIHPLYAGGAGRVLLSGIPEPELAPLIEAAGAAGLDVAALRADLPRIRENGHHIGIGVRTPDVGSLSVAIRGATGLLGALTISGPASRWSRSAMEAALPDILELARPISEKLGGQPPSPRLRGGEGER
jgi:IclR family acetate operon transcriptional repressor